MSKTRIAIFLIKFFLIGALYIVSINNLALNVESNREIFLDKYSSWIYNTFDNTYGIVGDAIKLEWLPEGNNYTSDK